MLTIFIFISSSTFYSKVLPSIELVFLKTGSNFLLFYFYCSIVLLLFSVRNGVWSSLQNCFLKAGLTTALFRKTAIAGRVNAVLTPF